VVLGDDGDLVLRIFGEEESGGEAGDSCSGGSVSGCNKVMATWLSLS
jgi:hypothetical protein